MIRRPPRSTLDRSSAASDVYKRQGYNFLRDSLKLDLFNLYLRATLFEKISITANAILDPYQTDANGVDIDKFAWQGGKFKLGRLSYGSISMSTSLRSKPKDAKKEAERKKRTEQQLNDPNLIGDQQRLLDYMQQNPSEFVDFNVPWQLNIGYSLYFSTRLKPDLSGFRKEVTSSINFSGSFNLTPKWNFSVSNVNYDFTTKQIQTFSMSINREMHCWQLSINVTPVGLYRCLLYTSDAADERSSVDLGGRRIIKKNKQLHNVESIRIQQINIPYNTRNQ